jgi:hypothetical protein
VTVIDLPSRLTTAKPERPSIATPILNKERICKSLEEIDQNIDLLFCVKGTIVGSQDVPDEVIAALNMIHGRLRRLTDNLFAIL